MATNITDKSMQAKPTDRDQWLHEKFERGAGVFAARITAAGERLFYFRYTDSAGKRPYLRLGPYKQRGGVGGYTVEEARVLARERSQLYLTGVRDLHQHFKTTAEAASVAAANAKHRADAERRDLTDVTARQAKERESRITVRALFTRWKETELHPRTRADGRRIGRIDHGQYTADQFERRVFPHIGDIPASEVRKRDLMEILDTAKAEGKLRTANVLHADLKQMFRFAQVREIVVTNPLELVTKKDIGGASVERERVLSSDEIIALSIALPLSGLGLRSQAAVWIVLATGARIGELTGAAWNDALPKAEMLQRVAQAGGTKIGFVDLQRKTWHLPTTKNQRAHTIHLSEFALRQFERLLAMRELGPWVFPSASSAGAISLKSLGKQLSDRQRPADRRLKNRTAQTNSLALPGGRWTSHDLRRTTATLMAGLGVSTDVIEECLNHKIASKVARVYIRDRRLTEQAKAFAALGELLSTLHSEAVSSSL